MRCLRTLYVICLVAVLAGVAHAGVTPFTFVQITDTHMFADRPYRDANLKAALAEINAMRPRPDFIIHTGDITDLGTEDEFGRYRAIARDALMPVYTVPGNHEGRWADVGIQRYDREFGAGRVSFRHKGVRFIGFDANIPLRGDGIVTAATRRWIAAQLAKDPAGTPAVLFCHQPPLYPYWSGMTGDAALFDAIAPYNVIGFITGHGHNFRTWRVNGTFCHMSRTMMESGYTIYEVGPDAMRVYEKDVGQERRPTVTVPLAKARAALRIRPLGVDKDLPDRRYFEAVVEMPPPVAAKVKSVEWQVDAHQRQSGPWRSVPPTGAGRYPFAVDTGGLAPGRHTLAVRAVEGEANVWETQVPLNAGTEWRTWDAGSPLQAPVAVADGAVFAGAWDGRLYALDAASLKPRWFHRVGGRIVGGPAVDGQNVYVASMQGRVVAIERKTGKAAWTFDAGSPVQGHLLAADGALYFGSGDHRFHALDAGTGRPIWTAMLGLHAQALPALVDGVLCFGAWDQRFHALDAKTGRTLWTRDFGPSTFYSPGAASPAASNGRVVFTVPTPEKGAANVYCVAARTGKVLWTFALPENRWCEVSPVADARSVYVAAGNGDVIALDMETGKPRWTAATGEPPAEFGRTLVAGRLLAVSVFGGLRAIDSVSGRVAWERKAGDGYTYAWPVEHNSIIYQPSTDGILTEFHGP